MGEADVRRRLIRYLAGESTLFDLDAALSQQVWNDSSPESARELANQIALRLDEYSGGHISETQLRQSLLPFVTRYTSVVFVTSDPLRIQTGTNDRTSTTSTLVGTSLVTAHA